MKTRNKPAELSDFSAGMFYGFPPSEIPDDGLEYSKNMYWDHGLRKRPGLNWGWQAPADPHTATDPDFLAGAYMYSSDLGNWILVYLMSDPDEPYVGFWYTELSSGTWSTPSVCGDWGTNTAEPSSVSRLWCAKQIGETVVFVDQAGVNRPYVVKYDGGDIKFGLLDEHAEKSITEDLWWAGQHEVLYVDDTTDAQDAGAADFQLYGSAINGHYVSSVEKFSKITYVAIAGVAGFGIPGYFYYNDQGTWSGISPVNQEPDWENGAAGLVLSFDIPSDWVPWDSKDGDYADPVGAPGTMSGRYVFKIDFAGATGTGSCTSLSVSNNRVISNIFGGDIPTQMEVHNSKLFLAAKNTVHYSNYNDTTSWHDYDVEYFDEGGPDIKAMVSFKEALYIFKTAAVHGFYGTSVENYQIRKELNYGTVLTWRSIVSYEDNLFFINNNNEIVMFDGEGGTVVSASIRYWIREELVDYLTEDNDLVVGFQSLDKVALGVWDGTRCKLMVLDIDSIRRQDGEVEASWWYWESTLTIHDLIKNTEVLEPGSMHFWAKSMTLPGVMEFTGPKDNAIFSDMETAYNVEIRTKDYSFSRGQTEKAYSRMKIRSKGSVYTVTMRPDIDTSRDVSVSIGALESVLPTSVADGSLTSDQASLGDLAVGYAIASLDHYYGGALVSAISAGGPPHTISLTGGTAHTGAAFTDVDFCPNLWQNDTFSVPYAMAGKNLKIIIVMTAQCDFQIDSIVIDYRNRRY